MPVTRDGLKCVENINYKFNYLDILKTRELKILQTKSG